MLIFQEQYKSQIKQLADQMRREAMPSLTEELFSLFETTGNRLKYEEVYFMHRKFLAVFGMVAYLFERPEYVAKLEEILQDICKEECWALPAHVNRKEDPNWRTTVDLFASETAQALAEISVLVNEKLPENKRLSVSLCEMVRSEIERRVLVPFEQKSQNWECSDHNWNAVCCGSIGSAALYLLVGKEEARLKAFIERICHSLTFYLDGFREDGACMEGIGYFTYGMTYFVGFAEQLLRYSNGKINLFNSDKVQKIAEFQQKLYFNCGQTVSFSDGETQAKFRMGLTCFLAEQYDTVKIPGPEFAADFETDSCYRFMGLMRDYLWTGQRNSGGELTVSAARHEVLPFAQWSICESKNGVGFAIKGGNNGEPHNHNDIGSFLYVAEGEQLICDLGAGEYTADYFGPGRYGILCNSSQGHSVPILKGAFQGDGKNYKASRFEANGKGTTIIEFAGAYGAENVQYLTREASFSLENGRLEITDSFLIFVDREGKDESVEKTVCFTENIVTKGTVVLKGNTIFIQGEKASCKIQIEEKAKNLRVLEKMHSNHEGKQEVVRLIQWNVMPEQYQGEKGEQYYGVSKYTIWQCRTNFDL